MDWQEKMGERPNFITLMTDRLHLGFLGSYGNSWIGTDTFDRLSIDSVLFDQYYATTLSLPDLYAAFWHGSDPALTVQEPVPSVKREENRRGIFKYLRKEKEPVSLPGLSGLPFELRERGYRTIFLSDDASLFPLAESSGFAEADLLPGSSELPAERLEETSFYFQTVRAAEIAEQLEQSSEPFFLWIHLSGFGSFWDVPLSDREEAREDEDDPEPYSETSVPFVDFSVDVEPDFDLVRSIAETYAAGVRAWDAALGIFIDLFEGSSLADSAHFVLGGTRGFPLGEHKRVGVFPDYSGHLYSEEIHLPLLFRFPGKRFESVRSSALCGPDDLYRTFLCLAGLGNTEVKTLADLASEDSDSIRSHLNLTVKDGETLYRGLITDKWHYILDKTAEPPKRELYLHPNDRWEVNEVADRCDEEILAELERKIHARGFS